MAVIKWKKRLICDALGRHNLNHNPLTRIATELQMENSFRGSEGCMLAKALHCWDTVSRVATDPSEAEVIFEDPSIFFIMEEATKDKVYMEVLGLVERGVKSEELRRLSKSCEAKRWKYAWETLGIAEMGARKLLIVDGSRMVIHQGARAKVLETLHKGHLGRDR